jgi:hypothetical protein
MLQTVSLPGRTFTQLASPHQIPELHDAVFPPPQVTRVSSSSFLRQLDSCRNASGSISLGGPYECGSSQ